MASGDGADAAPGGGASRTHQRRPSAQFADTIPGGNWWARLVRAVGSQVGG